MTITVGTNSYISEDDADAYFAARLYSDAWDGATTDTREKAILMACSVLEHQMEWQGLPAVHDQVMAWPRVHVPGVDPDAIPNAIKNAQAELALYLLGTNPTATPKTAGYKSLTVDTLKMEIDKADRLPVIPAHVADMLAPIGFPKANRPTMQVSR